MEIDPFARPWALGFAYIHLRQYDAAVNELRLRAEAKPQDALIRLMLSDAYSQKGMGKESARELEEVLLLDGDKESAATIRQAFASGGARAVAEWRLENTKAETRKGYVSPLRLAYRYARLGRKEEALRFLEDAYRERSPWLVFLQNEGDFDFLHSDERFRAIVRKMGLQPAY
jgi:tetratricopeptide (TPR) repeat protein